MGCDNLLYKRDLSKHAKRNQFNEKVTLVTQVVNFNNNQLQVVPFTRQLTLLNWDQIKRKGFLPHGSI